MSEAAAAAVAPVATPESSSNAPASEPVATSIERPEPANDNSAPPRSMSASEQPANDNAEAGAEPSVEDIYDLENLADELRSKKFRIKYGDQERVVDTAEALRLAQVGHAGYEAFRKAAEREKAVTAKEQALRAEVENLRASFNRSPLQVLREMGLEDALYADLERELQYQQMPEHERARFDLEQQRRQIEQERAAWQQQQEEAQRAVYERQVQAEAQRHVATFTQQYNAALDAAGVPSDATLREEAIPFMARMHEQALSSGVDVPVEVLARKVRERFERLGVSLVRSTPAEKVPELLGNKFREAQQADVRRVQQARAPNGQFQSPQSAPKSAPQERTKARFSSMRDWQRALDSKGK